MPIVGSLYAASVAHGFPGILLRGLLCAICLLPPTVLMGATLPAIARWIGTTGTGVSWLGFFWVPLYESTPDVVKSEIATFFQVFPNGTIWGNLNNGEGYDVVLLGQVDPGPLDAHGAQLRLRSPDHAAVQASLAEVGFGSLVDLLATYAGHAEDLEPWLHNAEINRDRNLRLQYLAGLQLNQYQAGSIYNEILGYRRFPEGHLMTSPELGEELRRRLGGEGNGKW